MYSFENDLSLSYEYCTCVTHEDGNKTTFRKVDHIDVKKDNSGYLFTFNDSTEETIDGKEPEDWSDIFLKYGKAFYPFTLQVSNEGRLIGVQDFQNLRNRCLIRWSELIEYYEHVNQSKNTSYSLLRSLKSEKMFLSILRRNLFYHLLFWQDDKENQEIEIQDFPTSKIISIYCFQGKGIKVGDALVYKTNDVYKNEGKRFLSGDCAINILRDEDGLPGEVRLFANVDELYYGCFKNEITLKRL